MRFKTLFYRLQQSSKIELIRSTWPLCWSGFPPRQWDSTAWNGVWRKSTDAWGSGWPSWRILPGVLRSWNDRHRRHERNASHFHWRRNNSAPNNCNQQWREQELIKFAASQIHEEVLPAEHIHPFLHLRHSGDDGVGGVCARNRLGDFRPGPQLAGDEQFTVPVLSAAERLSRQQSRPHLLIRERARLIRLDKVKIGDGYFECTFWYF